MCTGQLGPWHCKRHCDRGGDSVTDCHRRSQVVTVAPEVGCVQPGSEAPDSDSDRRRD